MIKYDDFIEKCKIANESITVDVYTERHHIIPKYMGGSNDSSNIIRLTYRQHILAHLLLYRKYRNIEDLTAYKLMKSLKHERKSIICKMIGYRHKMTGHIYRLGNFNKTTNRINTIKTKDSLRAGGKRAGQIAKETGQINRIKTIDGYIKGGKTRGNIAKESGQIQKLGKYKGEYILIMPDGAEFEHAFKASEYMQLPVKLILRRCHQGNMGYSKRKKTQDQLKNRWTDIK